ncbi:hypothetical protein IL252_11360 [Halomicrobium sp. IBSBa]|uniref:hypothetical protein n=1 Tax=Halomicrobium sp. IBSBa TaxID=2778916 RepID=UPI001ABF29DC|nr:hypothetical protein [Halomicrobium sp. IBSBa]MBO4248412.1 hypothetical protein [Halomicrobium sp. IBSBa]
MVWKLLGAGLIGWFAKSVWEKHGGKVAERLPIVEKLGLAESPPTVKRRKARTKVRKGNIRQDDDQ